MRRTIALGFLIMLLSGCARVPVEVRTAMEKQAAELQQIKAKHREQVDLLFAQIRILQLYILDQLESQYRARYARGPRPVVLDDKSQAVIYTDPKTAAGLPASGNPDLDVIAVSTEKIIVDWFSKKRADTEDQLLKTKEEFLKLQNHVDITLQINAAVTEYLDSLVNLRRAQDQLATNLLRRVNAIPGAAPFANNLINLLVPDTKDLDKGLPKVNP